MVPSTRWKFARTGLFAMSNDRAEEVVAALRTAGVWFLVDEESGAIAIPLPNERGGAFLLEVVAPEGEEEVLFRCGVVQVPAERRTEVLELINDLNGALKPFNRWSIIGEIAGVEVGCELREATNPLGLLQLALGRELHAISFGA